MNLAERLAQLSAESATVHSNAKGALDSLSRGHFRSDRRADRERATVAVDFRAPAAALDGLENAEGWPAGPSDSITFRDFVRGAAGLDRDVQAALSTGNDASAGYLLPKQLVLEVLPAIYAASTALRAGVTTRAAATGTVQFPRWDAPPSFAWREEGGTIAETSPTLGLVTARARSCSALVKATRELIADGGGAVDRELMSALSIAAADAIDTAIISGDGALQPSGILTRAAAGDVPLTALSGVPSWTAAFSAIERVLDADGNPPTSAVCSPRVWLDLPGGRLADGDGDPVEVPRAFEAINWFPTTKVIASGGSTSSIIFGGFEQVTLVLREAPTFQVLLERFATEGVIGIVCNMRADVVLGRSAHLDVIGSVTE